ncbi:DUF6020 family protein [Butyrivibrio sp. WCD3002]|uniref:DUF6020 family protein n=1 Tax=Butyrivibrio sp. WCD3002 TaxID=1280676 RepID=UPI0004141E0F|nr:DUF6020 family protein [Butyrivibrio sp. WCD3002]
MQRDKKRIDFMDICFSLCMSLITVINLNAVEDHFFLTGYVLVKDMLVFAVFFSLFFASTMALKYIGSKYDPKPLEKAAKKKMVLPAVLMWCAHLPYLLILAPGVLNYDTINQIRDVFDGVSPVPFGFVEGQETVNVFMNAHHPVVIAFLFAAFIKLGVLLGDPGKGLFIYCLIQSLVACFVFSGILTDIENNTKDSGKLFVVKAVRLFFTFSPFVPYYTICMLKNTIHSLLFLILLYGYYRYLEAGEISSVKGNVFMIVTSLLMCFSQNTGAYVVVLSSLLHLIFRKKNRKIFLINTCLCIVVWFIIVPKVIYPAANIYPGGKQEMLGTCFQQTARLVRDREDELTDEEKQIIGKILDYEKIKSDYAFDATDPVKATFNIHATNEDMTAYYKFWIRKGFQHPIIYLRAILPICGNFFAPVSSIQVFDKIPTSEGILENVKQVNPAKLWMGLNDWYYGLRDMPGISILFQVVLYSFWIPAYLLYYNVIKRGYKKSGERKPVNGILVPIFIFILMLVVSPVNYSRYALPLIFSSPVCLCMLMPEKNK